MSLNDWHKAGWLKPHQTSRQQVTDLFAIVDRDLADAALKLCTVLLYAEGWRPEKTLAHYRTLQALPLILGDTRRDDADYLDACRNKRNIAEYDAVGQVSPQEAEELAGFVRELRESVVEWLGQTHAELSPWRK